MKKLMILSAVFLTACLLAACGTQDAAETTVPTEAMTTPAGETLDIPLTADFGGHEFRVLTAGNQAVEDFTVEEESEIVLDNAQYKCKVKVEEDYKVAISQDVEIAYSSGAGPGYMQIAKQVNAGDTDYDLALIAGYDVSALAYSGYLYDMRAVPEIDLSKSWWDQNATDSLSVKDVVFFTTGDITISDNKTAFCLMFNKDLVAEYHLDSPYDMVYDGEWTIENFGKLVKSVSGDLNQDGRYDENDLYGLLVWDDSIVGMVNAAGERCCVIREDGTIELTFFNENTLSALEQYAAIAYDQQHAFQFQRTGTPARTLWQNDQGLFLTYLIQDISKFREMESDFGVLPYPKLTAEQEEHYSSIAPYNSQFICLPLVQEDISRTGTLTEALAYYGQKIVLPAFYDITLIGQSARDEESEGMLDIIFDNLVYDIGYYYQIGPYNKQLIYLLRDRRTDFASMYDRYLSAANTMLGVINDYYAEAVAEWQK